MIEILYEDNHLLVVNKPAGWIVQGAKPEQSSLLDLCADYLRQKYHKPGNVFLGVVSRLDAPVTGVVPLARTSKAAARLNEQIRERKVTKIYWAIVDRPPPLEQGSLKQWVFRPESATKTLVSSEERPGWQAASLEYRMLREVAGGYLLEIQLETGRKHQIRAQLEACGCPLRGDVRYGGTPWVDGTIGLHCRTFATKHPTRDEVITWTARTPGVWRLEANS